MRFKNLMSFHLKLYRQKLQIKFALIHKQNLMDAAIKLVLDELVKAVTFFVNLRYAIFLLG